jgi:hypothetical protein
VTKRYPSAVVAARPPAGWGNGRVAFQCRLAGAAVAAILAMPTAAQMKRPNRRYLTPIPYF